MKVLTRPSYLRALKGLSETELNEVNSAIARLPEVFGAPHQHSGLGVRRVGRHTYEIRAGLRLRVIFLLKDGDAVLATVGNHDEVRRWMKENV